MGAMDELGWMPVCENCTYFKCVYSEGFGPTAINPPEYDCVVEKCRYECERNLFFELRDTMINLLDNFYREHPENSQLAARIFEATEEYFSEAFTGVFSTDDWDKELFSEETRNRREATRKESPEHSPRWY